MSYQELPFLKVLQDSSGGNKKTLKKDFLEKGEFPVVDQGKGLIAGYVNDRSLLCKSKPPVIVFGDHTRAIKYVDFEFAMGADGTKVLEPKKECDAKFLYYALKNLEIPSAGYSRHFKFLKEKTLPCPPLSEQKRIAKILGAADALRAKRRESIKQLDELLQSVFLDMFGDPITNPHGFVVQPLEQLIQADRPITYGILKPGPDFTTGVPYVRVVDIKNEKVMVNQLKKTSREIAIQYKRSTLIAGDLLMSIRGHVGRMAIVPPEAAGANITQDTARLALSAITPTYAMQCLTTKSMQHHMARRTKGAAVKGINLGDVKQIPIPVPKWDIQVKFATIVESVEKQKALFDSHLAELNLLFASLQSRAFKSEL